MYNINNNIHWTGRHSQWIFYCGFCIGLNKILGVTRLCWSYFTIFTFWPTLAFLMRNPKYPPRHHSSQVNSQRACCDSSYIIIINHIWGSLASPSVIQASAITRGSSSTWHWFHLHSLLQMKPGELRDPSIGGRSPRTEEHYFTTKKTSTSKAATH